MPMQKCSPSGKYANLFMTVPDRGFSKEDLKRFILAWHSTPSYLAIVREPYASPKAGFTHHYHVGFCADARVRIAKLVKASNKSKLFRGMDFRIPLVKRGGQARQIFDKYFRNPTKFKSLDEHPLLVMNRGPRPVFRGDWEDFALQYIRYKMPPPAPGSRADKARQLQTVSS